MSEVDSDEFDPGSVKRGEVLYEGKSKRVYRTDFEGLVWLEHKDDATAFNGVKHAVIEGKGRVNSRISAHLLELIEEEAGVPTHLVAELNETDHLCLAVDIIPVEVVVRNRAAGSLAKRLGLEQGLVLDEPLVELFYKSDALNDPMVTEDHALLFGWAAAWELAYMREAALKVNDVLEDFWAEHGLTLVDFKLEFGRWNGNQILLADEISPDGSRLWVAGTQQSMDKDVFRKDLGDLSETYSKLFNSIFGDEVAGEE